VSIVVSFRRSVADYPAALSALAINWVKQGADGFAVVDTAATPERGRALAAHASCPE